MRFPILAAGLVVALLFAANASAHTTIIEPLGSHFPYQRWIDESDVPTPDMTIAVVEGPCPELEELTAACTVPEQATIWMNVSNLGGFWPREVFLHEVGHDFDWSVLTPMDRSQFAHIRGSRNAWYDEEVAFGEGLEEVFADTYMSCALDLPNYFSDEFNGTYSPRSCAFIERVALAAKLGRD